MNLSREMNARIKQHPTSYMFPTQLGHHRMEKHNTDVERLRERFYKKLRHVERTRVGFKLKTLAVLDLEVQLLEKQLAGTNEDNLNHWWPSLLKKMGSPIGMVTFLSELAFTAQGLSVLRMSRGESYLVALVAALTLFSTAHFCGWSMKQKTQRLVSAGILVLNLASVFALAYLRSSFLVEENGGLYIDYQTPVLFVLGLTLSLFGFVLGYNSSTLQHQLEKQLIQRKSLHETVKRNILLHAERSAAKISAKRSQANQDIHQMWSEYLNAWPAEVPLPTWLGFQPEPELFKTYSAQELLAQGGYHELKNI